jgi:opacity protein-like surface antigen
MNQTTFRKLYLLGLLALPGAAFAQSTDAVIVGIVSDGSGAAAVGAAVTAVNDATGVAREGLTNETGAYRIGPLVPGTYTLTTKLNGFKTKVQKEVGLQTGAVLKIDFALEVGSISESIEVTGAAPMLQTQETSVGGVITTSQLQRIPVNGRNYTRLLVLMPGTSDVRAARGAATCRARRWCP